MRAARCCSESRRPLAPAALRARGSPPGRRGDRPAAAEPPGRAGRRARHNGSGRGRERERAGGRGFLPPRPAGEGPAGKVCAVPGAAAGGSWRRQNKAARGAEAAEARGLRSPPTPSAGNGRR